MRSDKRENNSQARQNQGCLKMRARNRQTIQEEAGNYWMSQAETFE